MKMLLELTPEEQEMFLKNKPFFRNKNSFCLGGTLKEAGEIFRQILFGKENASDVGMADAESK